MKPSQQPKRKKPRNTSVKEKSKQKQVPAEPYEEALDETLIVESKDKTVRIFCSYLMKTAIVNT